MKVSTTTLKNISGKTLYYLTISNELETEKMHVNIGEKTYEKAKKLTENNKTITQAEIEETKTKNNKNK